MIVVAFGKVIYPTGLELQAVEEEEDEEEVTTSQLLKP